MTIRWLTGRSWAFRYGLAIACFSLLIFSSTMLRRTWGISFDSTTLIILTMIASAWYLGRGPGIAVAVLFELTLDYYAWYPKDPYRFAIIAFNRAVLFGSLVLFASARRAAELRLREQGGRLEATLAAERIARAEAESANRVKDEFLTTVSHELRTPLNVILGWAATLTRHTTTDDTVMRGIQAIGRNAQAQARIVDDVLNFSGMVRGKLQIDAKPVALAPLVAEAVETLRLTAEGKGVRLSTELAQDTGAVMGDADRLRQIVLNLVSNAIKFTPAGGDILVVTAAAGPDVQLRVEDSGIGIAPAFLPHVFDAFRQADASATRTEGGLGLGLAIVRHLAELQGGSIDARSDGVGRGTVMTLRLPSAAAAAV